jgi:hypothetical protein
MAKLDALLAWFFTSLGIALVGFAILIVPTDAFASDYTGLCDFCANAADPAACAADCCKNKAGCGNTECSNECCLKACGGDAACQAKCCQAVCGSDTDCLSSCNAVGPACVILCSCPIFGPCTCSSGVANCGPTGLKCACPRTGPFCRAFCN